MAFDLTPEQEAQIFRDMEEFSSRVASKRATLTPQLAEVINNTIRRYPTTDASVLISSAQAYTDGRMTEDELNSFVENFNKMEYEKQLANQEAEKKKNRSWWQRNIASKFRSASRWAFAGADFTVQSFQNLASQVFNLPQTIGESATNVYAQNAGAGYTGSPVAAISNTAAITEPFSQQGFFISTNLGSMMENSRVSGDGYFIGGEAARLQGERARRYRGEIAGKAWSLGRGTASLVVQPGTIPYQILSGVVDAVPAIAIPAAPGSGKIKEGAKILANRAGLRTLSGLTNYSSAMIIPEKAAEFFGSRSGRKAIEVLTKVNSIDEAVEIFPSATPVFLKNLADTKTVEETKQLLIDSIGLADPKKGRAATSIDDINLSSWDNWKRNNLIQRESKVARLMAKVPGRHVVLAGGSDREKMESIRNVKNYLRSLNNARNKAVPQAMRKELVDKFARALIDDDGSMRGVVDTIEEVSRTAFRTFGWKDELSNKLMSGVREFKDIFERSLYGEPGAGGRTADHGGEWVAQDGAGRVFVAKQPLNTAGTVTEMLKHIMMLPDPRQIRRLTSGPLGWLTGKTGLIGDAAKRGEIRWPVAAMDSVTNRLWKPLALITGAYAVRNMSDSLLRQTFSPDLKSGIYHPLDLIMIASHKRYRGDILGNMLKGEPEDLLRSHQRELVEATNMGMREVDPVTRHIREMQTGAWSRVIREDGADKFAQGVAAETALLAGDPVFRMVANGDSMDEIIAFLNGDGQQHLSRIQNMWANKNLVDTATGENTIGTIKFIDDDGTAFRPNIEEYVHRYVNPRIEATTGGSSKLREVIAKAGYTDDAGKIIPVFDMDGYGVYGYFEDNLFPMLKEVMNDPNVTLKEFYKMQVMGKTSLKAGDPVSEGKNWLVNKFFGELYAKREAWLNRSPAFRQFYYKLVGEWIDELAPGEADNIVRAIQKAAKDEGKKFNLSYMRKYLGSDDLARRIDERAGKWVDGVFQPPQVASTGKLTHRELDAYAKGYALDETKRLFYDAAEKSNFADILRIIVPFGSAWAEVTKKWTKMLTSDPETLKRVGVSVQGIRGADPDNDGKGFFYKDPTTGEYMFNYPFEEQLGPFITGFAGAVLGGLTFGLPGALVGSGLMGGAGAVMQTKLGGINPFAAAPARSFNMVLNLTPGTAPWVQIPAAAILSRKPELDFLSKIVTPYGAPDMSAAIAPSWAIKLYEATLGDPEKDRWFGDLVGDTMKALSASGKYDLSDPRQIEELQNDAIGKARVLGVFSALGQLAGPTRPRIEFKVNTKQGDVYANELSKVFYEMQAENYDTAVERFLEMFGDDAFMYVAGKTRAIDGGLDASVEFGRWERKNQGLFKTYSEVAGYFAPVGSTFDYQVYLRQIESGSRERLTPDELIKVAQFRVGSAMYRSLRREFGQNPTDAQEGVLRKFKQEMYDRYPGYQNAELDVNQRRTRINNLYDASKDSRLDDNPVAQALRIYFEARDEAVAIARSRGIETGLGGKVNADIRGQLFRIGESLSSQFPEFDRVWDRVLFGELDIDLGAVM